MKIIIRNEANYEKVVIGDTKNSKDLKSAIDTCGTLKNLNPEKIRLFYGGKELKNDVELHNYKLEDESIVQMMYLG